MRRLLPLLLFPLTAHAEVMDKELSVAALVWLGIFFAAVSYLLGRYKPWWLIAHALLAGLLFGGALSEFNDPDVGTALALEGSGDSRAA